MKKGLILSAAVVLFSIWGCGDAGAVVNDVIKVGLRYDSSALFSANLENDVGSGYEFGWFDEERDFISVGWTEEEAISMTASGSIYLSSDGTYSPSGSGWEMGPWRVEVTGFDDYDEALEAARDMGGWPAWIHGEYVARTGCYGSRSEAEDAAGRYGGQAVKASDTGITVTITRTDEIIFEYDDVTSALGVEPQGQNTATWFKNNRYAGAFEYVRQEDALTVINVLDVEDYVKGVIPYEMSPQWPLAALEAQAVCARTYAMGSIRHLSSAGFDICNSTHCQVYYGCGSATDLTNEAVDNTRGECLYYNGELVADAVYHSSNGGATEDAENVWGGDVGYLQGKEDPYEGQTAIPDYEWSVTYTMEELTWILQQKGYDIGTVERVYIAEYTPQGNVYSIIFEGTRGTQKFTGESCRTIFYSSTYNKSVRSMRFTINGQAPSSDVIYINNGGESLRGLDGTSVITGSGTVDRLEGSSFTALSAYGQERVSASGGTDSSSQVTAGAVTITGSGNGHNVGLSQYGAKAMAELGYDYEEILTFYYTDVVIR